MSLGTAGRVGISPRATTSDRSAAVECRGARRTVAEEIAAQLRAAGVSAVFGIPGVHNLPLWSVLGSMGLRCITTRHEQAAMHAADGLSRVTGGLGVCVTTSGPGAANTVSASGEAMTAGSSVLHVTTTSPLGLRDPAGRRRGVVHELGEQAAIFRPVSKAVYSPRTALAVGQCIESAIADAMAAPRGPVYVDVPTDLLECLVPDEGVADPTVASTGRLDVPSAALQAMSEAKAPLVWVGNGAIDADVCALAGHLGAPLVGTLMARTAIDPRSPFAVNGPVHEPAVEELVRESDLVIAIGTDFDGQVTQNFRMRIPGPIVRVDVVASQLDLNAPAAYPVMMYADAFIHEVLLRLPPASPQRHQEGARRAAETNARIEQRVSADDRDRVAWQLIQELARAVPNDVPIVADMTMVGYWAGAYLRREKPRTLTYPMGWGSLGVGLPTAIGAAVGSGGPAVALLGDAGALYAIGELATIRQERLPVVVVVFNDDGYGVLRYGADPDQTQGLGRLESPDFVAVARGFGVAARTTDLVDLPRVVSEALQERMPVLIETMNVTHPPVSIGPRWPLVHGLSSPQQSAS